MTMHLLAVCGAHLSGQPLNPVLRRLGAEFRSVTRTAPCYRMVLIDADDAVPVPRPGLIRRAEGGAAIEVELYRIPAAGLGELVAGIRTPLAIGSVLLAGGESVAGFVCEGYVDSTAGDITAFGGWRSYLAAAATR